MGGPRRRRPPGRARPPGRPGQPGAPRRPGQAPPGRRARPPQAPSGQARPAQPKRTRRIVGHRTVRVHRRQGVTRLAGEARASQGPVDQLVPDGEMAQINPNQTEPLSIGWFSSGGGEGSMGMLEATVDAIELGNTTRATCNFDSALHIERHTKNTGTSLHNST